MYVPDFLIKLNDYGEDDLQEKFSNGINKETVDNMVSCVENLIEKFNARKDNKVKQASM